MKRLITLAAVCFALLLGVPASANATTGTTVDSAPICRSYDGGDLDQGALNRWIELNAKLEAGTLTPEESFEGGLLQEQCGAVIGGVPVTVIQSDGGDIWLEFPDGFVAIAKSDALIED